MNASQRPLYLTFLPLALVSLCVISGCSGAGPAANSPGEAKSARKSAEEILARTVATYREANAYADQATYSRRRVSRNEGVSREKVLHEMSLAVEKPNKIRFRMQQIYPKSKRNVSYDVASNGTITRSAAGLLRGQIHETKSPATLTAENFIPEPNIRKAALEVSLENIYPQLAMMLASDESKPVFPQDGKPRLLSDEKLGQRLCHRLLMESPAGKRTLWIDAETFMLLRMELPIKGQMGSLDPDSRFSQYSVWIDYQDASLNTEVAPETFALDVPTDTRRVSKLVFPPQPEHSPRLGKPVGNFNFTTLNNAEITPETVAGKVVVLDFWYSKCPPCQAHTPLLDKVYQEFKENDQVLYYGVNVDLPKRGLTNEQVQELFTSWGGSFTVLRDLKETSDFEMGIRRYPHMVVLGPSGRVLFDEPGEHKETQPLVELIQKILDGGDPTEEVLAKHQEALDQFERDLEGATLGEVESAALGESTDAG